MRTQPTPFGSTSFANGNEDDVEVWTEDRSIGIRQTLDMIYLHPRTVDAFCQELKRRAEQLLADADAEALADGQGAIR